MIRKCESPACGLRFPAPADDERVATCPMCEAADAPIVAQISERGLPTSQLDPTPRRVTAVLDNVRSALNTGTILRTAEGAGVAHVHLCGITPTPENPKVIKTALGAEFSIGWSHHLDAVELVDELRSEGTELWVIEVATASEPLAASLTSIPDGDVTLVVGNEVTGVDPALIERADRLLHLPMAGTKTSLNVGVAFGVAAYSLVSA